MRVDLYLSRYGITVDVEGVMQEGIRELTPIPPKYQVETIEGAFMSFEVPKVMIEDGILRVGE